MLAALRHVDLDCVRLHHDLGYITLNQVPLGRRFGTLAIHVALEMLRQRALTTMLSTSGAGTRVTLLNGIEQGAVYDGSCSPRRTAPR